MIVRKSFTEAAKRLIRFFQQQQSKNKYLNPSGQT
jgi:hypothetical protein